MIDLTMLFFNTQPYIIQPDINTDTLDSRGNTRVTSQSGIWLIKILKRNSSLWLVTLEICAAQQDIMFMTREKSSVLLDICPNIHYHTFEMEHSPAATHSDSHISKTDYLVVLYRFKKYACLCFWCDFRWSYFVNLQFSTYSLFPISSSFQNI